MEKGRENLMYKRNGENLLTKGREEGKRGREGSMEERRDGGKRGRVLGLLRI